MKLKNFTTEAKVGIFVILSIIGLIYLSVRINRGGLNFRQDRTLYIMFDSASGLLVRTAVEYAGIRVGAVESIELVNKRARVKVLMDPDIKVFQDSEVGVNNRGLLGEKVLSLNGGGNLPEIPDGGTIEATYSGAGFDDAFKKFDEIAESIKDLIKGGDGRPSLRDVISNVTDLSEDLRGIVRGNKKELNDIVKNVNEFTKMLNDGDLKQIIVNMRSTSDTLRAFVTDANPQLRDVVGDVKNVMAKLDETVMSLNRIVTKVERGEGTIGKLLNDETTVNKVNDTLDGVNDFVGRIKRLEVAVGFRGEYLASAQELQAVASFRIQPNYDKYFLFEFTDGPIENSKRSTTITDTTTTPPGTSVREEETTRNNKFMFSAIFARRFYDLTLKAGLFRSRGGFGAEYHLFRDHLSLAVDVFDFPRDERPHLKLYAMLHLFKIVTLSGGVDDLIHRTGNRNYFAGMGLMLTDNDLKTLIGLAPLMPN